MLSSPCNWLFSPINVVGGEGRLVEVELSGNLERFPPELNRQGFPLLR